MLPATAEVRDIAELVADALVERPAGGGENMDTVLSWIKEGLSCR